MEIGVNMMMLYRQNLNASSEGNALSLWERKYQQNNNSED
jgi:hypothetical protein